MLNRCFFFLLLFAALPALHGCNFFPAKAVDKVLAQHGFVLKGEGLENFQKAERREADPDGLHFYTNSDGQYFRILFFENLSEQEATQMLRERGLFLSNLFATKNVPYIGKVSTSESCLSKNQFLSKLENKAGGFSIEYQLMATKNFVYGACSEAEDIYKSKYILQYCKSKKVLVDLKYFWPSGGSEENRFQLECEN